ncbi:MAG: peptide-methionine (S)-S-oxide reductase [Betaproteobacteria bacterium RIFCSPLOWO2_12_FULL_65_14]|nr:MAG: peptide-methionine (S)-S-oxide reductase [Betaproteobacteria bacterium RIFCSPLOWO2_12_FULL_65_14]
MKKIAYLIAFAATSLVGAMTGPAIAQTAKPAAEKPVTAKATFAGGCFWCVEEAFDKVPGVVATTSGYLGGHTKNPTYEQVSGGRTGHAEVVQVEYDPKRVSYEKLIEAFWRNVDPTQKDAQFCDHGSQYRSGIFYHDAEQRRLAEASKAALAKNKPFKGEIVTEITKASEFYAAEGYHQDYYQKNPVRYKFYKTGCGREARLKKLWR